MATPGGRKFDWDPLFPFVLQSPISLLMPTTRAIPAHHQPIAVMLDFVDPQRAGWRSRHLRRLARFDKAEGWRTITYFSFSTFAAISGYWPIL